MADQPPLLTDILARLRRPLSLTWAGLLAERLVQAFWPLWTLLIALAAALMLGWHEIAMIELVWVVSVVAALSAVGLAIRGALRFRWPRRAEALARMDAGLPDHPLASLADAQAIGRGDAASEALWRAHQARMLERAAAARAAAPDLRLARRDPFGLRYIALLGLVVALLFGSVWRVGSVGGIVPAGGEALAAGPTWEGWIEPPRYTGLPSLYLADQKARITAPVGSTVTLRFYGPAGALSLSETVSGRTADLGAATDPEQNFTIRHDGTLSIDGPGGRDWRVTAQPDQPPRVALLDEGGRTTFDGQMSLPFEAGDDYGVTGGEAVFRLDLDRVERRHGLTGEPDARDPIVLPLPLPVTGDRRDFTEQLIENLSQHPWAHLPVTLELRATDAQEQIGESAPQEMSLPARRFFDPLAAAIIEQRRDLLWARANGARVAQVLRAISHRPEDGVFPSAASYLRMRMIIRRLETALETGLPDVAREEIAQGLWDLALMLEDGDIGDALARMREAQERLSEAMKNGASDDEIARLMQELRDATQDYLRQKSQQAQRENDLDQPDQGERNAMRMTQDDLQRMMDRIQELMEQGRMAEAEQALQELQQMMENMRVTQGQGGQSEGQQAMEDLAETLREQQGLSDQAFRDLQEQFNPGAQAGESEGNEGRSGGQGRGQSHEGQGQGRAEGQGQSGQSGQPGSEQSLADRQQALRDELSRQQGRMPGAGTPEGDAARDALDRAGRAMDGAERSLRQNDYADAIDQQSDAMEALREGMRALGEAMAQEQQNQPGQGTAEGDMRAQNRDPLGRNTGSNGSLGTPENLLQGEDVYRRARELLDEIRRRSGEGDRPEIERDYLERLLERF